MVVVDRHALFPMVAEPVSGMGTGVAGVFAFVGRVEKGMVGEWRRREGCSNGRQRKMARHDQELFVVHQQRLFLFSYIV
jgi:hypothetical protein